MTSTVLFVLGEPGVGKTTLVRKLLPLVTRLVPSPKWTVGGDIVAAGHYTGATFDGADTIPYNGAKAAIAYWREHLLPRSLTIFDGARFSTKPLLEAIRATGCRIVGVHLVAKDEAINRRRERGSNQAESWIKGAATGAKNFAEAIGAFTIDGRHSMVYIEDQVRNLLTK